MAKAVLAQTRKFGAFFDPRPFTHDARSFLGTINARPKLKLHLDDSA